jgi:pilus assembly protein FimV
MLSWHANSEKPEEVRMRVRPILTLGAVAGTLMLPSAAGALGLGKLTVDSALGQPLSAQIEVTAVAPGELDTLSVKIADPSLYRQNNLAYNPALSRARVTLERRGNQPILRVSTPAAINEPYLDLMVELNWASGRLVREYTFLLDPPGVAPTPVEPVAPVRIGAAPPRPAPAAAAAAAPAPAAAPATASGADTYVVKRGDTLSQIASETKAPGVTLEQMLVALYNANAGGFDGNNLNRLRAGSILTIPSPEAAAATPPAEAARVVRMQATDWRSYRDRVAATAPSTDSSGSRTAAGRIGTTVADSVPAPAPGRDQLTVSREAAPAKGAAAATEETIARDRQIREAQQRIAELEKTLNELQRAVELKNQTMASLQAQVEAGKTTAARPAEPPKAVEPPKAAETAKPAEAPKAGEPAKVAEAPAPAPKPAPAAAPKADASFLDNLMANTPAWAIGGGALVLLAGIAAIIASRRRQAATYDSGVIPPTDIKTNTVFGATGGGVVNTGDNSLSSDFSREGLGSIDTDEVDPIAEAEVYLAYGRDAQAEEILKHALRKEPQRQEIYLKLLEIHAQHNKPSAFETVAAELYSLSKGQGDTWQKAVALGRQLDPANPMFADGKFVAATPEATTPPSPAVIASAATTVARAVPAGNDKSFDFRLDEDLAVPVSGGPRSKSPGDILAGAESELAKTSRAMSGGAAAATIAAGTAAVAGLAARGKAIGEPVAEAIEQKIETARLAADLDFHLDEAEKPVSDAGRAADPGSRTTGQASIGLDKLDLSFDEPKRGADEVTPSVLDGQWHDAATKLDLAKAYQEMGDIEGAREILQEVLREGDDRQKSEAQALIGKLG